MPRMNGRGPEMKGPGTGRGLGRCRKDASDETTRQLGSGMGLRRQLGGGKGKGKRLRSGNMDQPSNVKT
jgi:hypothetical protein